MDIEYRDEQKFIQINLLYSIAYQIPLLFFLPYSMEELKPLTAEETGKMFPKFGTSSVLNWESEQGIYVSQNPINKKYMYTLHHCEFKMPLNFLVPFYLDLLEINPIIPQVTNNESSGEILQL